MSILPFNENPTITAYPHYSFMCSIIETTDLGRQWMEQAYLQIASYTYHTPRDDYKDFRLLFYPGAGIGDGDLWNICPLIDKVTLPREAIDYDCIDFVKKWIDREWYISLYVNQFFRTDLTPENPVIIHPILVFGYDKEYIYCADCFEKWKYGVKKLTYAEFNCAVIDTEVSVEEFNSGNGIQLYKMSDWYPNDLDYNFLLQQCNDYLNSTLSDYYNPMNYRNGKWYYTEAGDYGEMHFGEQVYSDLIQVIDEAIEEKYPWNLQGLLAPDLRLLTNKAELLRNKFEYLNIPNMEYNKFQDFIDTAKIMENLLLKYNLSKNIALLDRLKAKIIYYRSLDTYFILRLKDFLEKEINKNGGRFI